MAKRKSTKGQTTINKAKKRLSSLHDQCNRCTSKQRYETKRHKGATHFITIFFSPLSS
jgi:hypothetical protein